MPEEPMLAPTAPPQGGSSFPLASVREGAVSVFFADTDGVSTSAESKAWASLRFLIQSG